MPVFHKETPSCTIVLVDLAFQNVIILQVVYTKELKNPNKKSYFPNSQLYCWFTTEHPVPYFSPFIKHSLFYTIIIFYNFCRTSNFFDFFDFFLMYVFLTPPSLSGIVQVHEDAIGCLEQTNNLGNLGKGTLVWSPQGHHNIL